MENAVEAIKIAGGVLLFVLALTVSISSFSQANKSVTSIVNMSDRDIKILYDQIKPSNGLNRTVGIETIVPSLYTALNENIEIYFKDVNGNDLPVFYDLDSNGEIKIENTEKLTISNISLANIDEKRLDMILAGKNDIPDYIDGTTKERYKNIYYYSDGFYKFLEGKKFNENLGEYYPIDDSNSGSTSTQIKKRIITYQEVN